MTLFRTYTSQGVLKWRLFKVDGTFYCWLTDLPER